MLSQSSEYLGRIIHVLLCHDLVDIICDQRCIDDQRYELQRKEEAGGEESVCDHLGQDELEVRRLAQSPAYRISPGQAHLIELVAEVDRVEVVLAVCKAFAVRPGQQAGFAP